MYATLRHELAHLALHDAVRVRVPLWFDEGYASWAAAEWGRLATLDLNLAVARGAIPDLGSLDGALRGSAGSAGPAYALAASAVVELARRNPSGSLTPLMERLAAGQEFAPSVRATTGLTMAQFEAEWRRAIRKRYSLVTWLAAGGGWGVVALGIWGLIRLRRRRDRERRAALDVGWVVPEDVEAVELDRTSER
jgi:hypothetical protein